MATLEIYPPVALYIAGRFAHLPRKAHVEDYAIAMNLDEQSLHDYAVDRALYCPGDVIRACDLQISMTDDVDDLVVQLQETTHQVRTYLHKLAHCYRLGLPCHTFLG